MTVYVLAGQTIHGTTVTSCDRWHREPGPEASPVTAGARVSAVDDAGRVWIWCRTDNGWEPT